MVQEAEKYKAEDETHRVRVEARNGAPLAWEAAAGALSTGSGWRLQAAGCLLEGLQQAGQLRCRASLPAGRPAPALA